MPCVKFDFLIFGSVCNYVVSEVVLKTMINPDFKGKDVGWKRFSTRLLFIYAVECLMQIEMHCESERETKSRLSERLLRAMLRERSFDRKGKLKEQNDTLLWLTGPRMYRFLGMYQTVDRALIKSPKYAAELRTSRSISLPGNKNLPSFPVTTNPLSSASRSNEEKESDAVSNAASTSAAPVPPPRRGRKRQRETRDDPGLTTQSAGRENRIQDAERPTARAAVWNLALSETPIPVENGPDIESVPAGPKKYFMDNFTSKFQVSNQFLLSYIHIHAIVKTVLYKMYEDGNTWKKVVGQDAELMRSVMMFRIAPGVPLWHLSNSQRSFRNNKWKSLKNKHGVGDITHWSQLFDGGHLNPTAKARASFRAATRYIDRKQVALLWEHCHLTRPETDWIASNVDKSSFCNCYVDIHNSPLFPQPYREDVQRYIDTSTDIGSHVSILANGIFNPKSMGVLLEKKRLYDEKRFRLQRHYIEHRDIDEDLFAEMREYLESIRFDMNHKPHWSIQRDQGL